jgi:hypothetical protein
MLKMVFFYLNQKISPLSVPKKYLRWCRKSKRFEWTLLDPRLLGLDNIFKGVDLPLDLPLATNKSSATSQLASEFLIANVT